MRTTRVMLAGLLGAFAALSLVAATKAPKKTYTVVGYYAGAQPSAALLEKASKAVGERMAGFTQVMDPNEAQHTVQVKFTRQNFEVYVDALPLERRPNATVEKQSLFQWSQQGDLARERAESSRASN